MKIFGLGMPELVIILLVVLLIFGPKQLPKLGKAFGKTVKGHGVSFMENNVSWHAGCVNEADWIKAKAEITEAYERKWGAEA